jgi:hypothetical protein
LSNYGLDWFKLYEKAIWDVIKEKTILPLPDLENIIFEI